jgi:hypothetical protein
MDQIPITAHELSVAMMRAGEKARHGVASGDVDDLAQIIYVCDDGFPEVNYASFGLSESEVTALLRARAQQLYAVMLGVPGSPNVVEILDMPYFGDFDDLLCPGASLELVACAIQWSQDRYAEIMELAADPRTAFEAARHLCGHMVMWRDVDVHVRASGEDILPTDLIYSGLGFTVDDVRARIAFWAQFITS